uniref:Defensin 2B n=1 Tax=Octodonta nipae TaxID=1432747 RepID=A0A5S9H874_9CUCU|nr:defensin 2B [Octodonta nipae]
MKIVFGLLLAIAVTALSQPIDFEEEQPAQKDHIRVRRFTCDVLSAEGAGFKVNHAACAGHCLALGKSGGYCNGQGVCICR